MKFALPFQHLLEVLFLITIIPFIQSCFVLSFLILLRCYCGYSKGTLLALLLNVMIPHELFFVLLGKTD
jgi:hypothetical protein